MAKNRSRYPSTAVSRYSQGLKDKKLKKKNPKKYKRQKFIRKISQDGKISKEEGQKAAEKGISLQSIQNRNIDSYRAAGRAFDNRDPEVYNPRNRTGTRPTFEPLKIKRGAYNALTTPRTAAPAAGSSDTATAPVDTTTDTAETTTPPVEVAEEVDFAKMIADNNATNRQMFEDMMASNQAAADQRASEYESQLTRMREEQAAAQAEYQRRAAEQQKQFELAQRTSLGNQARAGQQANYQLGGAPGMRKGGTFGFRRRNRQLMGGIMGAAIAAGAGAGTLNV